MTTIKIRPGFIAEVERSAGVKDACMHKAQAGADFAQTIAPVATGAYRDSIHAEGTADGAKIVAGGGAVDYAGYLEVGTIHNPPFHTLLHAGEALKHL